MKKAIIVLTIALSAGAVALTAGPATMLTVVFGTPAITCPGDATIEYTVTSTSAQEAGVVETLSGPVTRSASYTIKSGNVANGWTVAGRTKTFDGVFHATNLTDGDYTLQVCVTEAGSNGNPAKTVCESQAFTVNCAELVINPCANEAPFGEVVGNTHISHTSSVQIQFAGDFGDYASIEITGDNNFYAATTVNRNGDSCNYHVNWKFTNENGADLYGTPQPGVYSAKVTGNGKTLQFAIVLH